MDYDFEAMVRDRAYARWEDEGRPEGRDHAHWVDACREVASAMQTAKAPAAPAAKAARTKAKPAPRKADRRAAGAGGHATA